MASIASESPEEPPSNYSVEENVSKSLALEENIPYLAYAMQQAQIAQETIETSLENAIQSTRSRVNRIINTSSAHFNQTIDSLKEVKSEYSVYEDIAFGKIKEGLLVAASHPFLTTGAALGLGIFGFKRPRRFLYYNTMRFFASEEAMLSRGDAKVKELRKLIDLLKAETEKLERTASQAEEEMTRGRIKLRQTGKQIQSVINSAYKIERKAGGLKDVLKELPTREASRFRSQVSNLAKEAKQERNTLNKEVSKISNYGISV